jgi:hypothetical protein
VVDGRTEGDLVILESSNVDFTFQYWFFADRIAVKVLRAKGDYCFLLECVAGGSAEGEDYFVTADGYPAHSQWRVGAIQAEVDLYWRPQGEACDVLREDPR